MSERKESKEIIIIKIGSSSLCTKDQKPNLVLWAGLVDAIVKLRSHYHVILVTSGAVAHGAARMNMSKTACNCDLATKQAFAAIGQSEVIRTYDQLFRMFQQPIAQVLLTRDNLCVSSQAEH